MLRAIIHDDSEGSRKYEGDVWQLTAISPRVLLQIIRPFCADIESHTCHGDALKRKRLLFDLAMSWKWLLSGIGGVVVEVGGYFGKRWIEGRRSLLSRANLRSHRGPQLVVIRSL